MSHPHRTEKEASEELEKFLQEHKASPKGAASLTAAPLQAAATPLDGTLVPTIAIDYKDGTWSDQENPNSTNERKTWPIEAGKSYYAVISIGATTKKFTPFVASNTVEIQSNYLKDPVSGFPAVFYYKL